MVEVEGGWAKGGLDDQTFANTWFVEKNADTILEYSKTSWACVCWIWSCRQAPQASGRTWSCWWCTPPPVRGCVLFLHFERIS